MKTMWRLLLPIALCVTAIAQNNSTSSADRPTYITQVVVIDTGTGDGFAF
jgi:hypothetical protein